MEKSYFKKIISSRILFLPIETWWNRLFKVIFLSAIVVASVAGFSVGYGAKRDTGVFHSFPQDEVTRDTLNYIPAGYATYKCNAGGIPFSDSVENDLYERCSELKKTWGSKVEIIAYKTEYKHKYGFSKRFVYGLIYMIGCATLSGLLLQYAYRSTVFIAKGKKKQ